MTDGQLPTLRPVITTGGGVVLLVRENGRTIATGALCPDLLELGDIGEADNWRGRVVRGFFWLLRAWPA